MATISAVKGAVLPYGAAVGAVGLATLLTAALWPHHVGASTALGLAAVMVSAWYGGIRTDGYEALIKLGAFRPSLLILDVVMPRLDGIEVCRRLKTGPETRAIKVLGITGYPEMIPGLLEAGAEACLAKPLDVQQLKMELDRLLSS